MKIYLVQNKTDKKYLHIKYGALVSWVPKDEASIYNTYADAYQAGDFTFDCEDDAHTKYTIVEIDTDAALEILCDLNDAYQLGDFIYAVRDSEGEGWDGPRVKKWSDAVIRYEKLLERLE